MNSLKMKILEELIEHMSHLKGKGFKSMLDESKLPPKEMPLEEEGMEEPKGISLEKVELSGKPSFDDKANEAIRGLSGKHEGEEAMEGKDEEDMSDEELAELLKRCM